MSSERSDARQIIKALRSGATPTQFADKIFVGQQSWFEWSVRLMEENAEDSHFEVRFVKAAYGGGKTLFMRRLEATARARGWATAYILLRHGKVELDKPITLVAELSEQIDLAEQGRGMLSLLTTALERKSRECGIVPGRASTLAAQQEFERRVRDLFAGRSIESDVGIALRQACRAVLRRDTDRLAEIAKWLSGGAAALVVPGPGAHARGFVLKPLGIGAAEGLMRLIAELALMAGRRGFFLAIDEVELIAGFSDRRRANAFQTLRALVDQNDHTSLPAATSMFIAATPQMFEDPKMFPSYKALQDRIESLPGLDGTRAINYKANVIDLEATPLCVSELRDLGERILTFWHGSGEPVPRDAQAKVSDIANAVTSRGDYMIARPRLFCRLVVDMLEGTLGPDPGLAASRVAAQIGQARQREVAGE